jgi:hypothetical protein
MACFAWRSTKSLVVLIAASLIPTFAAAEESAQGPRYTYLGAGYEWTDTKCAIEPEQRIEGYTIEGSLGLFDFLHILGEYSDGDSDFDDPDTGISKERDFKCYRAGLGLNFGLTETVDIVGRAYYVDAEIDARRTSRTLDDDGYELEGLFRIMASETTEVHVGLAYTDLSDTDDNEVRIGLVHNVTPMVALRLGGVIFDDDTGINVGIRVYFGDSLF